MLFATAIGTHAGTTTAMSDYHLGEGQTRWLNCPRCDELIFVAQCEGLAVKLSRRSVPLSDAMILGQYNVCLWRIWRGMTKWFVTPWFPDEGRPSRGRLYLRHDCLFRK